MNPADVRAVLKPKVRWQRNGGDLWRAWIPGKEVLIPLDAYAAEAAVLQFLL